MEERPSVWRVAAIILNKHFWTADKGWSSSLGIGHGAYNSSPKKLALIRNVYTCLGPGLILWYDLRFGTWNVGSLYRSGSLTTIARELSRYKSYLVGVQGVRWGKVGHCKSRELYFFLWKRKRKSSNGDRIFLAQRIVRVAKRVEVVSDSMSCIVLRGSWCNVIVLNVLAPSEEKSDESKDSF